MITLYFKDGSRAPITLDKEIALSFARSDNICCIEELVRRGRTNEESNDEKNQNGNIYSGDQGSGAKYESVKRPGRKKKRLNNENEKKE